MPLTAQQRKNRNGFTLIEMAIVVTILGVLIASMTPLYTLYQKRQALDTTATNLSIISNAIGGFRSMNGRYPRPASLIADRDDPNYGREDLSDVATIAIAPGSCYEPDINTRICVEQSTRAAFAYNYPAGTPRNQSPRVLVGFVPFRHLNLDESEAYDGYDHRMLYVVTEHLTCADCFEADQGGIAILDSSGANSIINPPASAHFLVLSAGENGEGAYTKSGTQLDCPSAGPENENCDFRIQPDAVYQLSQTNTSNNAANHYDDAMTYFTQDQIPLWQMSTAAMHTDDIHQKTAGNVGIRVTASTELPERGVVHGAIRAQDKLETGILEGKIEASALCDSAGENCMVSSLIGGQVSSGEGMKCPDEGVHDGITNYDDDGDGVPETGPHMLGIQNGRPICGDVKIECDGNGIMVGILPDGSPDCGMQAENCPSETKTHCSTNVVLSAGATGSLQTVYAGTSGAFTYQCSDAGMWELTTAQSGECECTESTTTATIGCDAGYTGTQTVEEHHICPSGTNETTVLESNCSCVALNESYTTACPVGFTGSITASRDHSCPDGAWTDWAYTGSCICQPQTETQTVPCDGGMTGEITQTRQITCPAGTWSPWTETARNCTCEPQTVESPFPCPTGYSGSILKRTTMQCPEGSWSGWTDVPGGNSCVEDTQVVCSWENTDPGSPQIVPIGPVKGSPCRTCGEVSGCHQSSGNRFINFTTCVCGGAK